MHPTAIFTDIEALAKFCAELVRQGVMFDVQERGTGWRVTMTGY